MVYVTGDLHGGIDIKKLDSDRFLEQKNLSKDDCVIVCGDFGLLWAGTEREQVWLDWLENRSFTTAFCWGNHENFEMYKEIPVEEWNGGRVQRIRPSVLHLCSGEVFEIQGSRYFVMGGARSHDKERRTPGKSWWPEELPRVEDIQRAEEKLQEYGYRVDYVISHCASDRAQLRINPLYKADRLTWFFDQLEDKLEFKHWYFGHYHDDWRMDEKHTVLYQEVKRIPG